mmetsp:Transcript_40538/g.116540  ORF Transcript_40538/g.116540 Transcript_40538/m.116540 type:complete len:364 (+) Transcript_40538:91-1182(+)
MASPPASALAAASGQWAPTEEHITDVKGEVLLSDAEYQRFMELLPPGWRLVECTGFGDDSGSDDPEGSSSRVGAAAPGRGGLLGRGRGRGRGRGSQPAPEARPRRTSGRRAAAHSARSPSEEEEAPSARKRRRRSGAVAPPPAEPRSSAASTAQSGDGSMSRQEQEQLRQRIERAVEELSQQQLDRVIDFLREDLTDEKGDGTDFAVDIDALPLPRRQAMLEFVEQQLRDATAAKTALAEKAVADEAAAVATAEAAAAAEDAAAMPAPTAGSTPLAAQRRSNAWELCSAREIQKHHHLREVEERVSVAGTPTETPKHKKPQQPPGEDPPEAPLPEAAAVAGQGDSMLDNCEEVLSMLDDFSWM